MRRGVLEKLLPVVDNFERALAAIPEDEKGRPFESGVANIYKQLMTSLDSIGVKPMDCWDSSLIRHITMP
ncbi:MAG: nucleotide exchange factor GrpE [Coprococcus sp.]